MENLKILKTALSYKINVEDAYNMVFGLNTTLKFYFNNGQSMTIQRLSKGNRFNDEIIVQKIEADKELSLISNLMHSKEFGEFEAETQPEAVYDLIHNKQSENFIYKE